MDVGIVAPINMLEKHCTHSRLQYCYSSLIFQSRTYFEFYQKRVIKGDMVLLNTSPTSPRSEFNPDLLYRAALELKPKAIVLPSCDYSVSRTLSWAQVFLDKYKDKLYRPVKFVGVVQGADEKDLINCYKELLRFTDIIALPQIIEKIISRNEFIKSLKTSKPIVFLEVSTDPVPEFPRQSRVLGIVSAYPLRLAYELRKLYEFKPTPKPLDFFLKEEPIPSLAEDNVQTFLELEEL